MNKFQIAYLDNQNVNVIGVDWSTISNDYFYPNAAGAAITVGKYLSSIIDSWVKQGTMKYNDIHFIGHSLGAHVSGFTGQYTRRKLGRISGI